MTAWQQQRVAELRGRVAANLARRSDLEGVRASPTEAAAAADRIRRLDAEIAENCRDLADAERKLRDSP